MRINYMFSETKRTRRAQGLAFGLVMIFALLMLFGLQAATKPAHAIDFTAVFTVNSPGDQADQTPGDGSCFTGTFIFNVGAECTLRAAIEEANALRGADTIAFNISGNGPHTISPSTSLPLITKPVTIDGYTQGDATTDTSDDATENTETQPGKTNAILKIEIDGTNAGLFRNGLNLVEGASNVVVKGLVINNFRGAGIRSSDGTGHRIEGNFIGTDPSGTVDEGNAEGGVFVFDTDGSTVGGTSPAARNLISGNGLDGVWLQASTGNKIQGNLIGTDKHGTADLGNADRGVIIIFSSNNNIIGDSDPSDGLANAANTIAYNGQEGVVIFPGADLFSTGNRILGNSIHSNGNLGIELFTGHPPVGGVTPNDDKDPDTGANRLQNYPVLDPIQKSFGSTSTTVTGDLNSTPSTRKKKRTFIIQFFSSPTADASGYGEGETFLGQVQKTTNRKGNASFSFTTGAVSEGDYITATATNKKTGDTSEFSAAQEVKGLVIGGG